MHAVGLTRKRDLRDGDAVWSTYPVPKVLGTRLRRSIRTEVVVVGAGISGALIAQSLTTEKRDSLTKVKTMRIEKKLYRLFPKLDSRADVSWTGSFGGSPNGMPTIDEIQGFPRCYAVMGYGGNGITFSMLATKLVTAAILRKKCPEADLFTFK